jgi:hypothetical protein
VTCTFVSSVLVLTANALAISEHGSESDSELDSKLVEEGLAFLARVARVMPGSVTLRKMHAACSELSCRARVARGIFVMSRPGPKPESVAWLEREARLSAGHSALALVEAFTGAELKPLETRLWRPS